MRWWRSAPPIRSASGDCSTPRSPRHRMQLEALRARLAADAERAAIFLAHQELIEDPELLDQAAAGIRDGASAAFAWKEAYTAQADRLLLLKNQLIAGRATKPARRRTARAPSARRQRYPAPTLPADSILVAEDLAPSDAASLDRTRVLGFCTTSGSATSHAAILARGLGIPAIAGIDPRALDLPSGTRVILDGDAGVMRIAQPLRKSRRSLAAAPRPNSDARASSPSPRAGDDDGRSSDRGGREHRGCRRR